MCVKCNKFAVYVPGAGQSIQKSGSWYYVRNNLLRWYRLIGWVGAVENWNYLHRFFMERIYNVALCKWLEKRLLLIIAVCRFTLILMKQAHKIIILTRVDCLRLTSMRPDFWYFFFLLVNSHLWRIINYDWRVNKCNLSAMRRSRKKNK